MLNVVPLNSLRHDITTAPYRKGIHSVCVWGGGGGGGGYESELELDYGQTNHLDLYPQRKNMLGSYFSNSFHNT